MEVASLPSSRGVVLRVSCSLCVWMRRVLQCSRIHPPLIWSLSQEVGSVPRCFYEVEVAVLPDEIFRLVKIRFLIEDINDNAPLFPATVINISIPENSAINSRYALPAAIDPDIGINGVQNYHLIKVRLKTLF